MGLEDYKELVASCASITTMGHMLSGTLICKDIYRKGSSRGFDPMPFLGGVGMCILMLQYALIVKDPAMINVNVFGILANTVYMAVYYYFSPQMKETIALIGKAVAFVMVILAYAQLENAEKLEFRFGIIVTTLFFFFVGSPLIHIRDIIKTKNTDILPFPLIFMGTFVTFQWLLYGFLISNPFIIFQNTVALILCVAQLSLFVIYPSKSKDKSASQEKTD